MANNFFTIASLFYSLMLTIIYFRKKHVDILETKIYSYLVLTNFLNVLCAILCFVSILFMDKIPGINNIIGKTLLVFFFTWTFLFSMYVNMVVSKNNDKIFLNKKNSLLAIIYIIVVLVIYLLPLYYHSENKIIYSYGPSANLVYASTSIMILWWTYKISINFKILKNKKCIPIVLFIFLTIFVVIIQKMHPGLLLITAMETFITVLMYFTIENPDMKLLDEAHNAKEKADKSNYEKSMFLYDMTQEIRNTTNKIDDCADLILDTDDIDEKDDSARNIKSITANFGNMTNQVLDIANIGDKNIKVYNSKYSLKLLIKEIIVGYKAKFNKKELEFRNRIDSNIPEYLYGDKINLKRVIDIVLDNAYKHTNIGFVEFDVDSIIKHDICRLIITIEDSGVGIKASQIDKIFNKPKDEYGVDNSLRNNLYNAKVLLGTMGGTIMVTSETLNGSKFKIIIDQKIDNSAETIVSKYEDTYNKLNILIVDDSEAGIKIANKIFSKIDNVTLSVASSGKECLDKIRNKEKYEYIFIDEEMEPINGYELMTKLSEIKGFDATTILLSKNNNCEYDDEYKKYGFSNYLIKPLDKDKIISIIKESK